MWNFKNILWQLFDYRWSGHNSYMRIVHWRSTSFVIIVAGVDTLHSIKVPDSKIMKVPDSTKVSDHEVPIIACPLQAYCINEFQYQYQIQISKSDTNIDIIMWISDTNINIKYKYQMTINMTRLYRHRKNHNAHIRPYVHVCIKSLWLCL